MAEIAQPNNGHFRADNARARELYRYFQPPENPSSTLSAHGASSPDTTLTALAQLCAIRLNAKRAMISLIDRQNQYFIAEATKSLDLVNNNKSEVEGDGLWFGCGTVDKSGRLCEKTIDLPPTLGRYPCFTVKDLSLDARFNQLPFVTGPPYFKYYAGTPLTTRKGINIGSLFIIDDVVREELSQDQEEFLGTIAQTVMKHMEMTSEAQERKKVMRLSMGMNAFVEGKSRLGPKELGQDISLRIKPGTNGGAKPTIKKRSESGNRSLKSSPSKDPLYFARQSRSDIMGSPSEPEMSQDDSDSNQAPKSVDSGHRMTFARAANILCESLDVRDRGGVVFFDTTSRLRTVHDSSKIQSQRTAEVLSYSTCEAEMGLGDQPTLNNVQSFSPVDEILLSGLLSHYHRGKMWTFDEDGNLSSSEEDTLFPTLTNKTSENRKQNRITRDQAEVSLLQKHFPGVRQIMFSGLWDAGSSRWFTAGFAWTTSSRQIFTKETELSYFLAFGNSVMAEVSRLASITADRQKADFIGSISHEFRSPLHGILASAEFLAETEVDGFQSSLVDTISSCGRTLLDTINHILDYSKINSFERNWRNVRKPGSRARAPANRRMTDKEAPPMMNIYATIDVAAITEEVVEGVYAGHIYQDISSTDATDFSAADKAEAVDLGIARKKVGKVKEVEVQIDITHDDYTFTTQPGALKRLIMNVFGNALKYTSKGSITVRLSLEALDNRLERTSDERMLELKVIDTGKGISSEYLRTSLFNPFCQEDPLASGTGLGLSIVRSIVTMLRGNIDIRSEVGMGTEVTIRLPLSRLPGTDTPFSTPSSSTTQSSVGDTIKALKADFQHASVAVCGFNDYGQRSVLGDCIENWLGFKTLSPSSHGPVADVFVVDEKELADLSQNAQSTIPTVVLCDNASRTKSASRHDTKGVIEYVSKPVGPRKLAKALRSCLNRAEISKSGLALPVALYDEDSPMESEADTVIPDLDMEQLTLDSEEGQKPLEVHTNSIVTASESQNAKMAIDNSSSASGGVTVTEGEEFPFHAQNNTGDGRKVDKNQSPEERMAIENARYRGDLVRRDSRRPPLISRMTEPVARTPFHCTPALSNQNDQGVTLPLRPPNQPPFSQREAPQEKGNIGSLTVSNIALHNGETPTKQRASDFVEREKRPPRLLLVDDNKINLRLLETYMRKRKYKLIDLAENGHFAVQAAKAHEVGYDIIFMDISMPVMNGFEATRAIRDLEDTRSHNSQQVKAPAPALIVALTGLASSRDQTEAFTSGVDLFMTKPVSFKEVGRLLDNWEAHGGLKSQENSVSPAP